MSGNITSRDMTRTTGSGSGSGSRVHLPSGAPDSQTRS